MNYSTIQYENVYRGHAATIIATDVHNGAHSTDRSLEMSSPFFSHLIINYLLHARPDPTQMLLQLVFRNF